MTVLENIIASKQIEVERLLQVSIPFHAAKQPIPFKDTIATSSEVQIISEIKRASPSKGDIRTEINPVAQAKQYEACGTAAISVLTDTTFFKGSMEDLQAVAEAVRIPVLCKDFIIHPIQIDRAKAAGASIVLLIVAALSKQQLHDLYHYAINKGLEVICEVHQVTELEVLLELNPEIIGINNRNLKTFEVDLQTTAKLAALIPHRDTLIISESGFRTRSDALLARDAGAEVLLIGETLMRATNVSKAFNELKVAKERSTKHAR
ncbi:MAG: indole-3-glycerol phosphate synthase TrpC [Bacillota bacterium]|uniref:indole-3-glycerol phosphate synthase TrpC n=1 Tax=Virgibacillus sp. M23 TaxID=3079030 RepID=UPI002A912BC6|nr:indole-3-glycerol phosphate synthase TrpC [Virgibacillus sp. M23]MDY7046360.1 indole-3-glycerol phosphate synthase TrpC [Virgibacillus sp. M23]